MKHTAAAGRRAVPQGDAMHDPAWTLLEALCRRYADHETAVDAGREVGADAVAAIVRAPEFSWGALLQHAVTHKLLGVSALALLDDALDPLVPERLRRLLEEALDVNRHRIGVYYEAALALVTAAADEGLPIVARKGLVLEQTVHRARGARVFGDIDFMVRPDDGPRCHALLRRMGYSAGRYDRRSASVVPVDRRTAVAYGLYPDHLPKMVHPVSDPVVRYIEVDVATSFTWESSDYSVSLDEPLCRHEVLAPPRDGLAGLPAFSPAYQFIDVALHTFREAYVEKAERDGNPVTLSAFVDLLLIWRTYGEGMVADGLAHTLRTHGIAAPVGWALGHLDRLFGTAAVDALELGEDVTETWLSGRRAVGGRVDRWHGDMRQRLRDGGRVRVLSAPPAVASG